jgi:hypothetical protein
MDFLIDLFEPEKNPLDPFGSWLASQHLYICKKITPKFPDTTEGNWSALKECLTQYILRSYSQETGLLKSALNGDINHYEEKAIDAWLEATKHKPRNRPDQSWLVLEISEHTFVIHFFADEENGSWTFSCKPTIKL